MAKSGTSVDEVIQCRATGPGAALEQLLAAVAVDAGYRTLQVAPDRLQFARVFRPTWAIVAGCCTVWIGGIGALFFLVKTTESCLAVIETDHRGTRIRLSGRLTSAALGRIRSALSSTGSGDQLAHAVVPSDSHLPVGTPPPAGQPTVLADVEAPLTPGQPLIDLTAAPGSVGAPGSATSPPGTPVPAAAVASAAHARVGTDAPATTPPPPPYVVGGHSATGRSEPPRITEHPGRPTPDATPSQLRGSSFDPDVTVTPARALAGAATPVAVIDDGQRIPLRACTLVGRSPVAGPTDSEPLLVALEDPSMSVSKTHVAILHDGGGWFAEDRYSTNGVELVRSDGTARRLEPGSRVPVALGETLRFGERSLQLGVDHR